MRLRSLVGLAALVFLVLAYIETDSRAQQPGGGGFDFKNPDSIFARYLDAQKAKDSIEIDKVQSRMDPEMPAKMKAFAAKQGNTTGKMTKEQFADFWTKEALPQMEAKQKERAEKGGFGGFGQKDGGGTGGFGQKDSGGKGGFGGFGQKDGGGTGGFGQKDGGGTGGFGQKDGGAGGFGQRDSGGKGGFGGFGKDNFGKDGGEKTAGSFGEKDKGGKGPNPAGYEPKAFNEDEARGEFKNMDRDSNGSLNAQEYERSDIRKELEKYDVNKNATVEIDEWVAYRKDRHTAREDERKAWAEFQAARNPMNPAGPTAPVVPTSPVPLEGDKPTLNRVGALPKDLPAWFKELDEGKDGDKDGQVGLYEWRAGQRDLAEFKKYDRNEDGLLTPEEVLWYDKNADRLAGITPTGPAAPTTKTDKTVSAEKDKGKTGLFGGMFGRDKAGKDARKDGTKDAAKDTAKDTAKDAAKDTGKRK